MDKVTLKKEDKEPIVTSSLTNLTNIFRKSSSTRLSPMFPYNNMTKMIMVTTGLSIGKGGPCIFIFQKCTGHFRICNAGQ